MSLSFPLGRVLGIPVRVHASWFLVFGLVTWSFSTEIFRSHPIPIAFTAGILCALSLFGSVVLHELGHCVAARMFGIHVRRIQLFIFGGVAEIVGEPRKVFDEIVIAAAGPAVSFVLAASAGVFALLQQQLSGRSVGPGEFGSDVVFAFLLVMATVNFGLGLFNLIPAFPTDGGRILRAVLWGLSRDYRKATSWAAGVGMVFAGGLILVGVVSALHAAWAIQASGVADIGRAMFGGVWWAMIGIFLARSASQASSHARISAALRVGKVLDVMGPVRVAVAAERTLLDVLVGVGGPSASEMLLDGFPVAAADGTVIGFVEPSRLHVIHREKWGSTRAGEVMTPIGTLARLQEDEPLDGLLRSVAESGGGVLVYRGDVLVGYASRADLARWLFRDDGEEK